MKHQFFLLFYATALLAACSEQADPFPDSKQLPEAEKVTEKLLCAPLNPKS